MLLTMARQLRTRRPLQGPDGETLGQRIARLRKERGLTQVQLAEKLGVLQTHLSGYEHDTVRLHAEIVVRLANAFHVSADELLGLRHRDDTDVRPSLRLARRVKKIERLPLATQKTLLKTIDLFVAGAGNGSQAGGQGAPRRGPAEARR